MLAAYAPPPAELNIVPIIDVKSRAQAVRLETATRKLLKGLGHVLAAGARASALSALPAAAADYVQHANGPGVSNGGTYPAQGGDGDHGNPGGTISPSINGTYTQTGGPP